MEPDEKFVCFIQFNKYEDLGFFTEDLRIECCSHFAYMTRQEDKLNKYLGNRINILLVDPFCTHFQAALFKSYTNFDNAFYNEGDFVMKSVVQCNRVEQGLYDEQQ